MTAALEPPAIPNSTATEYQDALSMLARRAEMRGPWRSGELPGYPMSWRLFARSDVSTPDRGWKLHVSCATSEVLEMLDVVAPILLAGRSPFKLPATLEGVSWLNFGGGGETQLGKVMTIYAVDNRDFAGLARVLPAAWTSRRGPWILTDRIVRRDRRVFARWGAFRTRIQIDRCGRPHFVMTGPHGADVEDERRLDGRQPAWAPPAPLALDTTSRPPPLQAEQVVIEGSSFWPMHQYPSRAGTSVALAIDAGLGTAIIKRARRGALSDPDGCDAFDRLRNEFETLRALRDCGVPAPRPLGIEEDDDVLSIAQTDLGGPTIEQLPLDAQVASLPLLARAAARLHRAGFAHRDLKAQNAVRLVDCVALIDFELAGPVDRADCVTGGTVGYVGPEGAHRRAAFAADAYAFGATVFQVLTRIGPGSLPAEQRANRMVGILAREGHAAAAELVARFSCEEPAQRATLADACGDGPLAGSWSRMRVPAARPTAARRRRRHADKWLRCAFEAGVYASTFERTQEVGTAWQMIEEHGLSLGESLYSGAAGVVLVLRALGGQLGHADFATRAHQGAQWLSSRHPQRESHGLFTGNAGVAVTLAALARSDGDARLLDAARCRLTAAVTSDFEDPDLTSGSAGIVFAGVMISELVGQRWPLALIRRHADALIREVDRDPEGVCCWRSCVAYDPSRQPYYGVAHGAAGIAVSLARFSAAAGCEVSGQLAQETLCGLCERALEGPALRQGPGRTPMPVEIWCHGTTGLLWALLQVGDVFPTAEDLLERLVEPFLDAVTVPSTVGVCHGIAGVLEVVRGLAARGLGGRRSIETMHRLGDILLLLATRTSSGRSWNLAPTSATSPSLMEGFLGPAAALALAARPASSPAILSPAWLGHG